MLLKLTLVLIYIKINTIKFYLNYRISLKFDFLKLASSSFVKLNTLKLLSHKTLIF